MDHAKVALAARAMMAGVMTDLVSTARATADHQVADLVARMVVDPMVTSRSSACSHRRS